MSQDLRRQYEKYIGGLFVPGDDPLGWILEEARSNDLPFISIQPHEGYLLGWLMRLIGAKSVVEIGTLAGYSGTWMAQALPEDGALITVETVGKHAAVSRANFDKAGVGRKVTVMQGDALEVLSTLDGPFDMVFIDADRAHYPQYLAWAVENLRPGGIVSAHNALCHGGVLNPQNSDDHAVIAFNQALADDPRLDSFILPIGDGLAVGRRV